jgi:hypothetical protein
MYKREDTSDLFPIPKKIKHWCGDNVLADRAWEKYGVAFMPDSKIFHYVTQSGKTVPKEKYFSRIVQDVLEYRKYSGNNVDAILKTFFSS